MPEGTCSIDGCERAHQARGFCLMHYKRQRRAGMPTVRAETVEERLIKYSDREPDGCWLWTGAISSSGYGSLRGDAGRDDYLTAHRASYELYVGPVPEGLHLDHLCRVPACMRPDHLEPVTAEENNRRARRDGKRLHRRAS